MLAKAKIPNKWIFSFGEIFFHFWFSLRVWQPYCSIRKGLLLWYSRPDFLFFRWSFILINFPPSFRFLFHSCLLWWVFTRGLLETKRYIEKNPEKTQNIRLLILNEAMFCSLFGFVFCSFTSCRSHPVFSFRKKLVCFPYVLYFQFPGNFAVL